MHALGVTRETGRNMGCPTERPETGKQKPHRTVKR